MPDQSEIPSSPNEAKGPVKLGFFAWVKREARVAWNLFRDEFVKNLANWLLQGTTAGGGVLAGLLIVHYGSAVVRVDLPTLTVKFDQNATLVPNTIHHEVAKLPSLALDEVQVKPVELVAPTSLKLDARVSSDPSTPVNLRIATPVSIESNTAFGLRLTAPITFEHKTPLTVKIDTPLNVNTDVNVKTAAGTGCNDRICEELSGRLAGLQELGTQLESMRTELGQARSSMDTLQETVVALMQSKPVDLLFLRHKKPHRITLQYPDESPAASQSGSGSHPHSAFQVFEAQLELTATKIGKTVVVETTVLKGCQSGNSSTERITLPILAGSMDSAINGHRLPCGLPLRIGSALVYDPLVAQNFAAIRIHYSPSKTKAEKVPAGR